MAPPPKMLVENFRSNRGGHADHCEGAHTHEEVIHLLSNQKVYALPKTNMDPENDGLGNVTFFSTLRYWFFMIFQKLGGAKTTAEVGYGRILALGQIILRIFLWFPIISA